MHAFQELCDRLSCTCGPSFAARQRQPLFVPDRWRDYTQAFKQTESGTCSFQIGRVNSLYSFPRALRTVHPSSTSPWTPTAPFRSVSRIARFLIRLVKMSWPCSSKFIFALLGPSCATRGTRASTMLISRIGSRQ